MGFATVLIKIFTTILSKILVIASQKLVSRIVLSYKSIHNNRDIFQMRSQELAVGGCFGGWKQHQTILTQILIGLQSH